MIIQKERVSRPQGLRTGKKNKHKVFALLLLTLTLVCLTACGGATSSDAQPTATVVTAQQIQPAATATEPQAQPTSTTASQPTDTAESSMADMTTTPAGTIPASPAPTQAAGSSDATPTQVAASSTGTAVQATLIEWSIQLSQSQVPAGKVIFTVTNQGQMMHNFTVEGDSGVIARTPNFTGSQGPQTLEVTLQPGTYTVICSLPGHAQRGQIATLVVR